VNGKFTVKPTECESTAQCKKKMFYEHMPYEEWFPIYGVPKIKQGSSKCTNWASTQNVARLNSDCLIGWKIPGVSTNHLRSILFSLLQILIVIEFFRINRRLQMFPKLIRQAMYLSMYKHDIEEYMWK